MDVNTAPIKNQVEQLLRQWSKRKLILFGRITIIKLLALSKFIHLFLALSNPPGDFVKNVEKIFYKFLWNAGPDRIKRAVVTKDLRAGGLRMINIQYFIKALRITWLRRVIQSHENKTWYDLSDIDFEKVFTLGSGYARQCKQIISNPFWKDMLQIWADFCNAVSCETVDHVVESPLWYNKNLLNGENFCIHHWFKKGLRSINDLIDAHGNFYQFEELNGIYNIHGTFLDFQSLLRKIPDRWKTIINDNKIACMLNRYNVRSNVYVKYLLNRKKGCKPFYDVFALTNNFQRNIKWEQELGNIGDDEWRMHSLVIKSLKEVKLKDFQYKITNKILVTRSFLHRINKTDDNLCQYCQQQPETILHLFVQCPKVRRFWSVLHDWLLNNFGLTMSLENKTIMFPKDKKQQTDELFIHSCKVLCVRK